VKKADRLEIFSAGRAYRNRFEWGGGMWIIKIITCHPLPYDSYRSK